MSLSEPALINRAIRKKNKTMPLLFKKRGNLDQQSSNSSSSIGSSILQDFSDVNTLQPISDDPSHVMEKIANISASLLDISLNGFTVFKRALEYFVQLSEKMLQAQNTSHLATTRSTLKEKIEGFRSLLTQINSNPSHDNSSQIETFVNDISKSCRDLYNEVYSNK